MEAKLWHALYDDPGAYVVLSIVAGSVVIASLASLGRHSPSAARATALVLLVSWSVFVLVASIIGPPNLGAGLPRPPVEFVPLRSFTTIPPRTTAEVVGNLILFAPLGILLAFVRPRWQLGSVAASAATIAVLLEAGQWLANTGRHPTFDDVLLATIGASAAWIATRSVIARAIGSA